MDKWGQPPPGKWERRIGNLYAGFAVSLLAIGALVLLISLAVDLT